MTLQRIQPASFRTSLWRNGGGITHELAIHPPEATVAEGFGWRVSMAQVGSSGPFSPFPNMDRTLVLLEGAGMHLDFGEQGSFRLDRVLEPLAFSGDWTTTGTLLDGPCRDFNVITRRDAWRHQVTVLNLGPQGCALPQGAPWLGFVLRGNLQVLGQPVSEGELVRVEQEAGLLVPEAEGAVLLSVVLSPVTGS